MGSWCVVDKSTCGSFRAHGYGMNATNNATVDGVPVQLTGQGFDYWYGKQGLALGFILTPACKVPSKLLAQNNLGAV